MSCVITLLAHPDKEKLSPAHVQRVVAALAQAGVGVEREDWLKEGIACDLYVSPSPLAGEGCEVLRSEGTFRRSWVGGKLAHAATTPHPNPPPQGGREYITLTIHDILRGMPIDAIVQPAPKPHYKLLISDMDSTMITCECIDELADFVGKKADVSAVTERAMNGELDFAEALTERVALLAGLPEETLQQCYDERVRMMPGAKELLAAHKAAGGYSVLVSGGFSFFTSRVARELGFDEDQSNILDIKDKKLTGRVKLPILDKNAKLAALHDACKKLDISAADVLAIGDGANDLPMLLAAGLGVAYRAKPSVRAQAKAQLNHCDLSALAWVL